jgi:carbon storage regulator
MLVLQRKSGQGIYLSDGTYIVIKSVKGQYVRVGVKAPSSVKVLRAELVKAA